MLYRYAALISITIGGTEFLPGKEIPPHIGCDDLYKAGMVSRQKIDDREPNVEQTTGPVSTEITKPKKKSNGKRKNKSNR